MHLFFPPPPRATCPANHIILNLNAGKILSCRLCIVQEVLHSRKLPKKYWRHELFRDHVASALVLPLVSTVNRLSSSRSVQLAMSCVVTEVWGCDSLRRPNSRQWRGAMPQRWVVLQVPLRCEVLPELAAGISCCLTSNSLISTLGSGWLRSVAVGTVERMSPCWQ
jgi:hypothetical protein